MNLTTQDKFKKTYTVCFSVIMALTFIMITPTIIKAAEYSNKSRTTFSQNWRSVIGTSMAAPKSAGDESSVHSKEIILSAYESKMIALINQERAKAGLKELEIDFSLVKLAQWKSQDMVSHNYFGHISERFGSIYDQLSREGVSYQIVAENLAGTGNYLKAHQYFLASSIHRSNILNPRFTKVGIGIVRGGPYGMFITEVFLG